MSVTFTPPVQLSSGDSCDVPGALNQCPPGEICASATAGAPACLAEGSGCPVGWNAVALEDFSTGGSHVFEVDGDNAVAENVAGRGTCGGGGPQSVFSFTPNATDVWRFSTSSADEDADTLLVVRRECAATQPEFELACNDDNATPGEQVSSVEVSLTAGVAVFIVVDGYFNPSLGFDGFDGAFTLTARRLFQ